MNQKNICDNYKVCLFQRDIPTLSNSSSLILFLDSIVLNFYAR